MTLIILSWCHATMMLVANLLKLCILSKGKLFALWVGGLTAVLGSDVTTRNVMLARRGCLFYLLLKLCHKQHQALMKLTKINKTKLKQMEQSVNYCVVSCNICFLCYQFWLINVSQHSQTSVGAIHGTHNSKLINVSQHSQTSVGSHIWHPQLQCTNEMGPLMASQSAE
jgi:hypothetical protein